MALLAAVRTTRSLVPAHQDGQQNFLDSLAHSGSGPSSTLNSRFGQAGMSDALCRSASSRGWLGSQLPSRGRRSDGEEGEGSRLRRALQAASPSGPVLCSPGGSSALACVRAPCAQRHTDRLTELVPLQSTGPRSRGGERAQRGRKAGPWPGLSAGLLGFVPLLGHTPGPGGRATGRWQSGEG